MCPRGVSKIFTEVKESNTDFNVFVLCVLRKQCLQILTINLQAYFYHINLIQVSYENGRSIDKNLCNKIKQFWI